METVKAYVLVNNAGQWLTRPLGSMRVAVEEAEKECYQEVVCAVIEVSLIRGGSCNPVIFYA